MKNMLPQCRLPVVYAGTAQVAQVVSPPLGYRWSARELDFLTILRLAIVAALVLVVGACGGSGNSEPNTEDRREGATQQRSPSEERDGADTVENEVRTPEPQSEEVSQSSPDEIFAAFSPSIAFIETPTGTGSGILIGDGQIVTNAHVVWPFDQVRVIFPNGEEFPRAAVVGLDLMADIAVIEVTTSADLQPVATGTPEGLPVGAELFLIGYPAEFELSPQPTIATGVLSRFRAWEAIGLTYIQTDAAIAGGQSGGALVSPTGEVVGMSTFSFGEGNFALSIAMPDVMGRVQGLLRGIDVADLGDRRFPQASGVREFTFQLQNFFDQRSFVLRTAPGTTVVVAVESEQDAWITVSLSDGFNVATVDDGTSGRETIEFPIDFGEPYIVTVGQNSISPGQLVLSADVPLAELHDPEDGRLIRPGLPTLVNLDHPLDVDYFQIDLDSGEELTVFVETTNFDPFAVLDLPTNASEGFLAVGDDSGGGLFGLNARIIYTAVVPGRYVVAVEDAVQLSSGGYILTVEVKPVEIEGSASAGARTSVFDLDAGDCFNYLSGEPLADSGEFLEVNVTACEGDWHAQVLNTFSVQGSSISYPGEAYLYEQHLERCETGATNSFFPTRESWDAGDRSLTCIFEPAVLFAPEIGDCLISDDLLAVLPNDVVPCSDPHLAELYHRFDLSGPRYPGDAAVGARAERECLTAYGLYVGIDYARSQFYSTKVVPTRNTWERAGDRTVRCYLGSENFDEAQFGTARGSNW